MTDKTFKMLHGFTEGQRVTITSDENALSDIGVGPEYAGLNGELQRIDAWGEEDDVPFLVQPDGDLMSMWLGPETVEHFLKVGDVVQVVDNLWPEKHPSSTRLIDRIGKITDLSVFDPETPFEVTIYERGLSGAPFDVSWANPLEIKLYEGYTREADEDAVAGAIAQMHEDEQREEEYAKTMDEIMEEMVVLSGNDEGQQDDEQPTLKKDANGNYSFRVTCTPDDLAALVSLLGAVYPANEASRGLVLGLLQQITELHPDGYAFLAYADDRFPSYVTTDGYWVGDPDGRFIERQPAAVEFGKRTMDAPEPSTLTEEHLDSLTTRVVESENRLKVASIRLDEANHKADIYREERDAAKETAEFVSERAGELIDLLTDIERKIAGLRDEHIRKGMGL